MENCPFIDDFSFKTSIYRGVSMAMLNNQMVIMKIQDHNLRTQNSQILVMFPSHTQIANLSVPKVVRSPFESRIRWSWICCRVLGTRADLINMSQRMP